jgi:hypothetical protein
METSLTEQKSPLKEKKNPLKEKKSPLCVPLNFSFLLLSIWSIFHSICKIPHILSGLLVKWTFFGPLTLLRFTGHHSIPI